MRAELDAAAAANPDLHIDTVQDLSGFIKESRDGLVREGGLGALFAIITIFLFLMSLRSTLVAAVSIPLSIFAALTLMLVTGISINIMTLGGLAVAVGRVVDDAIVVLENIYRHRARGEDKRTAVLDGAREVSGAITASTATTVAVFLPLGFVGGLVSQFFLPFALTVTFALLASLLCALTVVPVLAYFLVDKVRMDVDEDGEPRRSIWIRAYTPAIRFAPAQPLDEVGPGGRRGRALRDVVRARPVDPDPVHQRRRREDPPGLRPAAPRHRIVGRPRADDRRREDPPGRSRRSSSSRRPSRARATPAARPSRPPSPVGPPTPRRSSSGSTRRSTSRPTPKKIADALAPLKTDGYDVAVSEATGFSGGGINVIVSSPDRAVVAKVSDALVTALKANPDLINIKSDLAQGAPTVEVKVDPNKALGAGLTTAQVAGELRNVLVPQRATRITIGDAADGRPLPPDRPEPGLVDRGPLEAPRRHGPDGSARGHRRGRPDRHPGQHHPDRRASRLIDLGRDHQRQHGRGLAGRDPGDRRGSRPTGRSRPASR